VILRLKIYENGQNGQKSVKISAVNSVGPGPFSPNFPIEIDPQNLKDPLYYGKSTFNGSSGAQYTWIIALLGSMAFMLILISSVLCYYRKNHQNPSKYLAANQQEQQQQQHLYHCTLKPAVQPVGQPGPLWIDPQQQQQQQQNHRYFDDSKEICGKLMSVSATMPNVKQQDCNNEYSYIGSSENNAESSSTNNRHSLSTFSGLISNTGPYSVTSITQQQQQQQKQQQADPEPYATTDILRTTVAATNDKEQQSHHYAVIIDATLLSDYNSVFLAYKLYLGGNILIYSVSTLVYIRGLWRPWSPRRLEPKALGAQGPRH
jgi:hypothetical protein